MTLLDCDDALLAELDDCALRLEEVREDPEDAFADDCWDDEEFAAKTPGMRKSTITAANTAREIHREQETLRIRR
ncbi:hypothetical protein HY213_04745 [Candidatus Peregrinibacteria bacterium]|nr:hypothetical protein [Candidatus Peregrinibacteria bacterium]